MSSLNNENNMNCDYNVIRNLTPDMNAAAAAVDAHAPHVFKNSGQDMEIVKVQFPPNPSFLGLANEKLEISEKEWTSIYIPVIPTNLHLSNHNNTTNKFYPKYLKNFLENNLNLGKIKRIDFVDRNIETSPVTVKGAFVHFDYWYDSDESKYMRHILNTKQKYRQMGYQYNDKLCTFYTRDEFGHTHSAYMMFKINHKPIEDAEYDVNVHQLKAVIKKFEQEKIESEQKIMDLQKVNSELKCRLDNLSSLANEWEGLDAPADPDHEEEFITLLDELRGPDEERSYN